MFASIQSASRFDSTVAITAETAATSAVAFEHAVPCARAYWPADTLDEFLLRMSAHGHCVSAAMMLGDRRYAVQQLERAQALGADLPLQVLVAKLASYFAGPSPFALSSRG